MNYIFIEIFSEIPFFEYQYGVESSMVLIFTEKYFRIHYCFVLSWFLLVMLLFYEHYKLVNKIKLSQQLDLIFRRARFPVGIHLWKLTAEALEQGVKYVQSKQKNTRTTSVTFF